MSGTWWQVGLADGCSFREHRPEDTVPPEEGELRACGNFEHYPAQFPASYQQITEDEFWRKFGEKPE